MSAVGHYLNLYIDRPNLLRREANRKPVSQTQDQDLRIKLVLVYTLRLITFFFVIARITFVEACLRFVLARLLLVLPRLILVVARRRGPRSTENRQYVQNNSHLVTTMYRVRQYYHLS